MNKIIAFCLVFSIGSTAHGITQDRLSESLQILRSRVIFIDESKAARYIAAGTETMDFSLGVLGSLAFLGLSTRSPLSQGLKFIVLGGGVAAIIGWVGRSFQQKPPVIPSRNTDYYKTVDGLNEFMRLELDQQYLVASQDPELIDILNGLADAQQSLQKFRAKLKE